MNKKIFENSRICPKGDIEANWNKAVGFVPLDKEIIIYKADTTHPTARFKVGDGKTVIQELPFSGTDIEAIEKLIDKKGELLIEYVDNAVAAIQLVQMDWSQNNPKAKDYIKNRPFYDEGTISSPLKTYIFDGVLEGKEYFIVDNSILLVKISDDILSDGQHVLVKTSIDESVETESVILDTGIGFYASQEGAIIVITDTQLFEDSLGIIAPSTGLYVFMTDGMYPSQITTIKIQEEIALKQIDEKYIPDSIARTEKLVPMEKNLEILFSKGESYQTFEILYDRTNAFTFDSFSTNLVVDWGDGTINKEHNHLYSKDGKYTIKVYFNNIEDIKNLIPSENLDQFKYVTGIIYPNGLTTIKNYSRKNFINLANVTIPDSVTSIGSHAFEGCRSLMSVVIPNSVMSIGSDAFRDCSSLTSVIFINPVPIDYNAQDIWFDNCPVLTNIYVPHGCKQAYKEKWTADGAEQDILDKIVESDREAMMSDLNEISNECVKFTDYATANKAGVAKFLSTRGIAVSAEGNAYIVAASKTQIEQKGTPYTPISPTVMDYAWKVSATTNTETWTDEDKAKACETIGAIPNSIPSQKNYGDGRLIGFTTDGKQVVYKNVFGTFIEAYSVPYRDGDGVLHANAPTTGTGLVPLEYFNQNKGTKFYKHTIDISIGLTIVIINNSSSTLEELFFIEQLISGAASAKVGGKNIVDCHYNGNEITLWVFESGQIKTYTFNEEDQYQETVTLL